MNLNKIDLNLLVVLSTLLKYRHITQASHALQMSQPAVSRALSRLRKTLNDPLLVRTKSRRYDLSSRAEELQPHLEQILGKLEHLVTSPNFEPKDSTETLRLYGLDIELSAFGPPLLALMSQQAPNMSLDLRSEPMDQFKLLDSGEVHFAISGFSPENNQDHYHRLKINEIDLVVIMRKQHPLADQELTLKHYLNAKHAMVSITGQGTIASSQLFKDIGEKPPAISLRLSSFANIGYFCEAEDVLFHLPREFSKRLCEKHALIIKEPPKELASPKIDIHLYWHKRHHHNPMCQWVRQQIKERPELFKAQSTI